MGTIHLVRHGQASFGESDYDRLSERGVRQGNELGRYFALRKIRFSAILTGTLRRHDETAQAIVRGLAAGGIDCAHVPQRLAGLNEYDPHALMTAFTGNAPSEVPEAQRRDPETVRQHFRALREALIAWTEGAISPTGMPRWLDFQQGAVAAMAQARSQYPNDDVLIVSSGGPIAAIVCDVLQAPARTAVELNLRIRNSAVSEFSTSARRHHLLTFNSIAHLETLDDPGHVTFA